MSIGNYVAAITFPIPSLVNRNFVGKEQDVEHRCRFLYVQ